MAHRKMRFLFAMNLSEYLVTRMGRAARDSVAMQVLSNEELFSQLLFLVRSGNKIQRMKSPGCFPVFIN
jgi:hypothetical protein